MSSHSEKHYIHRSGWLRAAVLGANDGIISTASLIIGVAMATSGKEELVISGLAALIAGAMSMAAGEYVSVSSQSDLEDAEIIREREELIKNPEAEEEELAAVYVSRGLTPKLAEQVAKEMTQHDALGAHIRDELGILDLTTARPLQAAVMSGAAFSLGAICPLLLVLLLPLSNIVPAISIFSLILLAALGCIGARIGGAHMLKPALRVMLWGGAAMGATAAIGQLIGISI